MQRIFLIFTAFILAACSGAAENSNVTIYTAKTILTQDTANPTAEAVAVGPNGTIIGVGSLSVMNSKFRGAVVDTAFENGTLLPGLIDPHVHMVLGAMMYGLEWIPPWDMTGPNGLVKGLPDKESLMARIAELETSAPDGPLILFGYHNLVQGDIDRADLDAITTTRPLFIWHYSGHDFYLNSAAIEMAKLTPALAEQFHGVDLDDSGELTGRIYEDAAIALLLYRRAIQRQQRIMGHRARCPARAYGEILGCWHRHPYPLKW